MPIYIYWVPAVQAQKQEATKESNNNKGHNPGYSQTHSQNRRHVLVVNYKNGKQVELQDMNLQWAHMHDLF